MKDPQHKSEFSHDLHHVSSVGLYLTIFGSLMALTFLTVAIAYVDLGPLNLPVAVGIACVKATLVILFFMHVKYSSKLVQVTVATGFFFLIIMFGITLTDYGSRPTTTAIIAPGK
ncbi:MAG: cytochrome C oxidase subunit IV family protein [Vicinamibacterales bacterium]